MIPRTTNVRSAYSASLFKHGELRRSSSIGLAALTMCAASAWAQICDNPEWTALEGRTGIQGTVWAAVPWDPDGPGPAPEVLVVGGIFSFAGDKPVSAIATWDGQNWTELGGGLFGWQGTAGVFSLLVLPDHRLVVGGSFFAAGGNTDAANIAIYDPVTGSWSGMGTEFGGFFDNVTALARMPDGRIAAGGYSDLLIDPDYQALVATFDGTSWAPLGATGNKFFSNVNAVPIRSLNVLSNGNLIAAGGFEEINAAVRNNIARWNGTSWAAMGAGLDGTVYATAIRNGQLYVGGDFTTAGTVASPGLARWTGSAWAKANTNTNVQVDFVLGLATTPSGDLLVQGDVTIGTQPPRFAKLSGTNTWAALTGSQSYGYSLDGYDVSPVAVMSDGRAFFTRPYHDRSVALHGLAQLVGTEFAPLGVGFDYSNNFYLPTGGQFAGINALSQASDGSLYAFGAFDTVGGTPSSGVAVRRNGQWRSFEPGPQPSLAGTVWTGVALSNGDLVVGINDLDTVKRWNGTSWSPMGALLSGPYNGPVYALAQAPNGDIIAGGHFDSSNGLPVNNIARWNGTAWVGLGGGVKRTDGSYSEVRSIAFRPNGNVLVGGYFNEAGGQAVNGIAEWDGTRWIALPAAPENRFVASIAVLSNGDILVGGSTSNPSGGSYSGLMRFDGVSWSSFGGGITPPFDGTYNETIGVVRSLKVLPGGDIVAAGSFSAAGTTAARDLARWNGITWTAYSGEVSNPNAPASYVKPDVNVNDVALLPDGSLAVAGDFTHANGQPASMFAILACSSTSCPADFDGDGFVTGDDFDAYVLAFEAGDIASDFDGDGFVTGDDFDAYVVAFEAGC